MTMAKEMLTITIISMGLLLLSNSVEPYKRPFDIGDESISRMYFRHDTITFIETAAVSVLVPLALMFATFRINSVERIHEIYFYASFLVTCLVGFAVVENTKNLAGRLRPDFLSRCNPVAGKCTGNPLVVLDGRKSFPSGHTSIAACGFMFLALFISKESTLPGLKAKVGRSSVFLLYFVFLMVPVAVGTSRVMDNKHFISDVIGGGSIGAFVGIARFKHLETAVAQERYKSIEA
ncbi:phosphatidic acid phosphatase-like protein [Encephalitozoon cuniculi]|uniref:Putative integral membrane protein YSX3 CAEEL n=1 Tax=Encephalitozoon cuniculi TaxID=6035 RepID=M1K594_ENCCN|nr:putative integral membrane protein YSX3 CAEEL [Encephalitozoon cuniculi]UYI26606.1 phosphatidic acid phosphatase-like protein [Encephalitozoon cuniculi]